VELGARIAVAVCREAAVLPLTEVRFVLFDAAAYGHFERALHEDA
jgi:hypothetical protein